MLKDKITLNVLADISKRLGNTTIITPNTTSEIGSNKRALVIFNGSNIEIQDKLREIKLLKDEGVSISIAFSFMGDGIIQEEKIIEYLRPDKIYKEEDIFKLKEISNRYSFIIAPTLTISTMSKVVGGFIDNFLSNLIWTFLYMGKDVYLDFTSTKNYLGEKCKNQAIERLIDKNIREIKELGAKEIRSGSYLRTILSKESPKTIDREPASVRSQGENTKEIWTERDIEKLAKTSNSLRLSRDSIITPLAKDRIKSLGISIIRD